ncbi:MAG: hypothetical protein LBL52_02260 [Rickettsiales bacterium]|nr:hypothetical protein [Rickettsiales bacterium]
MRRLILLILLAACGEATYSPDDVHLATIEGKTLLVDKKERPVSGLLERKENGDKVVLKVRDGVKISEQFYNARGKLVSETEFSPYRVRAFYPNGNLKREAVEDQSKRESSSRIYYLDGGVFSELKSVPGVGQSQTFFDKDGGVVLATSSADDSSDKCNEVIGRAMFRDGKGLPARGRVVIGSPEAPADPSIIFNFKEGRVDGDITYISEVSTETARYKNCDKVYGKTVLSDGTETETFVFKARGSVAVQYFPGQAQPYRVECKYAGEDKDGTLNVSGRLAETMAKKLEKNPNAFVCPSL